MGRFSTAVSSRWLACVWVTSIASAEPGSKLGSGARGLRRSLGVFSTGGLASGGSSIESTSNVLPFSRTSRVACRRSVISTKYSAFSGAWRRLLPYPFMRIERIERSGRS